MTEITPREQDLMRQLAYMTEARDTFKREAQSWQESSNEMRKLALHNADQREALRSDYDAACKLVADMHAAAIGTIAGPNRGVVEDVEDLRKERDALKTELAALKPDAERYRWLRHEHEVINPLSAVVWKQNSIRNSSDWVNTANLDADIDEAREGEAA